MEDKRVEKLLNRTIKKKELETLLKRLGYEQQGGKGSHAKWVRPGVDPILIASHSKDLKPYLIRYVTQKLIEAGLIGKE